MAETQTIRTIGVAGLYKWIGLSDEKKMPEILKAGKTAVEEKKDEILAAVRDFR